MPDSFTPKSSFLEKAEYDESSRSMTLTFHSGSQTKYLYVYPSTWLSFKQSPDHSSYYARAIKGKLSGVSVIKKTIGHQKTVPLHQKHNKRSLKNGSIFNAGRDANRGNTPTKFGK